MELEGADEYLKLHEEQGKEDQITASLSIKARPWCCVVSEECDQRPTSDLVASGLLKFIRGHDRYVNNYHVKQNKRTNKKKSKCKRKQVG